MAQLGPDFQGFSQAALKVWAAALSSQVQLQQPLLPGPLGILVGGSSSGLSAGGGSCLAGCWLEATSLLLQCDPLQQSKHVRRARENKSRMRKVTLHHFCRILLVGREFHGLAHMKGRGSEAALHTPLTPPMPHTYSQLSSRNTLYCTLGPAVPDLYLNISIGFQEFLHHDSPGTQREAVSCQFKSHLLAVSTVCPAAERPSVLWCW